MEKTFFEVFRRYQPEGNKRALLERAIDAKFKYVKDPLQVEVELTFPDHEDAETIYEIEDDCRALYGAHSFKILPHFPSHTYAPQRFSEIACEAALCGAVTQGFFSGAEYIDDGETVTVRLPFGEEGVNFVCAADTESILSRILYSRYGVQRTVRVEGDETRAADHAATWEQHREQKLREAERINAENFLREREEAKGRAQETKGGTQQAADPHADFAPQVSLAQDADTYICIDPTTYRVGLTTYSVANPTPVMGIPFEITEPTPIARAQGVRGSVLMLGTVFEVTTRESRGGDSVSVTVGISDGACGIYVRTYEKVGETAWFDGLKTGTPLAVYGSIRRDKMDNEPFLSPRGIQKIAIVPRMDTAPEKRVELHLHTNMSQMDAIITPAELVNTAIRWGHRAIAVTDHGNVQAFPEVMLALEKSGNTDLKILYGIEAYFVNDTARCLFGQNPGTFEDEICVFDIETTGLSSRTCRIIEIGAVIMRGGEILDRMDTFVDPEGPIPENITKLTSITDEMVAGAPREREAVEQFLGFAGDRLLVAHNANFDVGFIRTAAERHGLPFHNTYLDTVGLSKYVNPDLKNHKLDTVAAHYHLEDFHHHRASDDAEVLAQIFFRMLGQLRDEGVDSFQRMNDAMSERSDPLKLKTYHMVIFARTRDGLRNLYKLITHSYLDYYRRFPRMPKSVIEQYRDGLLIGSACEAGELYNAILEGRSSQDIEEIASFYDYLEIQPLCNNRFLIENGRVADEEALRDINRQIYALGKKLGKPVCATCDAHFLNREEEFYRHILLAGMKFSDADKPLPLYLRTTEEMLAEFSYLGEDICREVVIENPNKIADMCDYIRPIPKGRYEPSLPGANEQLTKSCWNRAHEWYGDPLPEIVESRLKRELDSIISHGFAVLYMIAVKLVSYSESLGYQVGSRGSVGSSFVATMSGISEVNPLPPHYRCPSCRHSEFITDGSVGSGFDLPDKKCPCCGTLMYQDGQDIPFETFLGFHGDKSPDIDLNFSGDVQSKVHKYTEELFGEGHVFRAGTISTLADKVAWGYVNKYLEERKIRLPKAEVGHMITRLIGVKKTTGQHPGGIIVVPREYDIHDFSPVQHPADDPSADTVTTHFQFSYLHDTILKLDELGHDVPTKYKMLEKYTGTSVLDVKMNDRTIYELFYTPAPLGITTEDIGGNPLATFGIPEFGTPFIQQVLMDAKPRNFADLLQISGLTHGTNVWLGNAQDLIKQGVCTISDVVGTRDGIMLYLIRHGIENATSFKIMEAVRKGKGLTPENEAVMREHGVPDWYIDSCKKIKYLFPKAHAAAYVMSAIRLCWYKIYYPMEFYAGFLSVAPGGFDAEIVSRGYTGVSATIKELEEKTDATAKDKELIATLQLVREALARKIVFLNVDLYKSDARYFLPEDGKIRMPFNSLAGLGDTAAERIVEARAESEFYSVEDLRVRTGISKSVIEILRRVGALKGLPETNQFSIF